MTVSSPQVLPLMPPTMDAIDWQITSAGTAVGQWQDNLSGMTTLAVQLRFLWGAGTGGVKAIIQSSLDGGNTGYDIAVVNFANVSRTVIFSVVSATTGIVLPGAGGLDASLSSESEGVLTSILGDRLRLVVINSGAYGNTLLSARVMAS
jgi:hypothetical protein